MSPDSETVVQTVIQREKLETARARRKETSGSTAPATMPPTSLITTITRSVYHKRQPLHTTARRPTGCLNKSHAERAQPKNTTSTCSQARREPQRGPGKHYCGAISPHSACLEMEETWREVSPHHPTRGSGERRKLPTPAGSGAEPRPKMDFMHILGQKEAI